MLQVIVSKYKERIGNIVAGNNPAQRCNWEMIGIVLKGGGSVY